MKNNKANLMNSPQFMEFMTSQMDKTYLGDAEYIELDRKLTQAVDRKDIEEISNAAVLVQTRAERLAYEQGWKDAFATCMGLLS